MSKRSTFRLIIGLLFLFAMAGCGEGDSDTNGTLSLDVSSSDLTGGLYRVVATAVYSNAGLSAADAPINIVTSVHTLNGTPVVFSDSLEADETGTVTSSRNIQQINEVIFVDVTASTGGLSRSETVVVPAL